MCFRDGNDWITRESALVGILFFKMSYQRFNNNDFIIAQENHSKRNFSKIIKLFTNYKFINPKKVADKCQSQFYCALYLQITRTVALGCVSLSRDMVARIKFNW